MALRRTAEPAVEPVTLTEAKLQCAVDGNDYDALLTLFIKAARRQAEAQCQRSLIDQQWTLTLDAFPDDPAGAIALPMPRVTAITSLTYTDAAGTPVVAAAPSYFLQNTGEYANLLLPAYGYTWPAARAQADAVTIIYRAGGADAAAVPEDIKHYCLLLVGQWFKTREAGVEKAIAEVPRGFWDRLLDTYRVVGV
jgi:uncharacterized phiE125 gp8 family phage protein